MFMGNIDLQPLSFLISSPLSLSHMYTYRWHGLNMIRVSFLGSFQYIMQGSFMQTEVWFKYEERKTE